KLPKDRESLFWLNVLEIPPKPTGAASRRNMLRFSFRTRLKLFFRPPNLKGSRPQAPTRLVWTLTGGKGAATLKVHNPTPYYITISAVSLSIGGKTHQASHGMVAPDADLSLKIKGLSGPVPAHARIKFWTINDYGAGVSHKVETGQ